MATTNNARRDDLPFDWAASCGMPLYAALAGVRYDRLFRDCDAIVESYKRGKPLAEELCGPDVAMGGPTWMGVSYGHINTLGAELIFPEDSEVAHTPIYGSLKEGIAGLKRDVDFTKQGMFPFYMELWRKLQKALPEEKIGFGLFKAEGPLTTGWLLRGHEFFMDILDQQEQAAEYMHAVVDSIVRYNKTLRRTFGQPEFSTTGAGLADDVSAMIAPAKWPQLVMPFLERYFTEQTSGTRGAHIEDLRVDHLKYLDELGLSTYDPSVSPKLTPALIRDNCSVSFTWKLNNHQYPTMTEEQIEAWVFDAAAGGASGVWTMVTREMNNAGSIAKVHAFIRAAKRVQKLVADGCPRSRLMQRI